MNSEKPSSRSPGVRYSGRWIRPEQRAGSQPSIQCGSSSRSTSSGASPGSTVPLQGLIGGLILLVLALVLGLGARSVIRSIADQPDVYTSYLTRECVRVENVDGTAGDCNKLPERYNNIWVE